MKRYPLLNYNDMAVENMTDASGVHHTQPDRRGELWAKWRDIQRRNDEWRATMGKGTQPINEDAVNNYYELQMMDV